MAKIKISELANQMEKRNVDIISALDALSIDNNGKRFVANSSIEEDVAEKVKKHLTAERSEQGTAKTEAKKTEVKTEERVTGTEGKIEKKAEGSKTEAKMEIKGNSSKTESLKIENTKAENIKSGNSKTETKIDNSKTEGKRTETGKTEAKTGSGKAESAKEEAKAEGGQEHKKKVSVVFNPQNSAQPTRSNNQRMNNNQNNGQRSNRENRDSQRSDRGQNNYNKENRDSQSRNDRENQNQNQNQNRDRDRERERDGQRNDRNDNRNDNRNDRNDRGYNKENRNGQRNDRGQGNYNRENSNRNERESQENSNRNNRENFNRNERENRENFNRNERDRDGQNRNERENRDGQRTENSTRNERGYNRENRGGQRNQSNYNRDGQKENRGQGTYNRDNNRQGGRSQGGYNKDSGYNKDRENNGRSGRRESLDKKIEKARPDFIEVKTERRQDRSDKDRKEKTNKFEDRPISKKFGKPIPEMVKPQKQVEKEPEIKVIQIPEVITIKELAEKMKLQPSAVVKKLFLQGKMVTINQEVNFETAEEIALEYDVICEKEVKVDVIEELLREEEEDEKTMVTRPPVICVMGHVDHGKTSLLDAIRSTNVIAKEAGGITQHIGAYVVEINGQKITFLDTPGHEAFTAMRMRGAQSTDIAILVVAADDGVMPQTVEAISHAKAAGLEIIVAVNKIDKPSANVDRVKQELIEHELVAEDWGGTTVFVPVSAHTKEGIEDLLEMILLTAEVKELKANPNRKARGLVIEAQLDKGRGPVATVLVQKGTLHVGDVIAAGSCHGKVRAMIDDKGRRVKEAKPSTPVEILGLNDVPNAGEIFVACDSEKEARSFAETFISQGKEKLLEDTKAKMSLDDLFSQIKAGNVKELNIIVKADVQGSVEAIKQSLIKLSNEEVVVKVIHGGVGAVNESDVSLASASNAIIIGFNVKPDPTAKSIAERESVDIRLYRVIYNAIEDVEAAMKGMLDPVFEEKIIGHAEVRQTFKASGVGTIAGSYILDGKFQRGAKCRITREGEQLFDGALASLKRFKDDVKEVAAGYECGLVFEKFNDIKEGDQVEAYIMEEVAR